VGFIHCRYPDVVFPELIVSLRFSLFSQYRFCLSAGLMGGAYGIKYKKGAMPLFVAGAAGTAVDFVYGYTVVCAKERDIHKAEKDKELQAKFNYDSKPN
jgi:hypothetical protein